MTNKFTLVAIVPVFLIWSVVCQADNLPDKLELDLGACIKIALQKNPQLHAAIEGVKSSHEAVDSARAPYYPELRALAGYNRWQTRAFLPDGLLPPSVPKVIGPTDDYQAKGIARWTLFDSGERGARLDITKIMAEISEENLNSIRQDVILRVHETFYRFAASMELRDVAIQNQKRTEQHLKFANERKSVGAVPESDVLRARVSVSEAKLELVRANNLIRVNMGWLNTVMGIPVETSITVKPGEENSVQLAETSPSSLLVQALMCRPEIKASQKRIESARKSLDMARSEYGPKVRAEGAYGYRDDTSDLGEKEYAAGLSVELPLFSGFSTRHKTVEKKIDIAKAEFEANAVIQAIQQEVWIARSRLREAEEIVQATDTRVKDAGESVRMAEERYRNGGCTITDLMDIQTVLARAEADLVEAKWNLRIAKVSLARSTGSLVPARE